MNMFVICSSRMIHLTGGDAAPPFCIVAHDKSDMFHGWRHFLVRGRLEGWIIAALIADVEVCYTRHTEIIKHWRESPAIGLFCGEVCSRCLVVRYLQSLISLSAHDLMGLSASQTSRNLRDSLGSHTWDLHWGH